MKYIKTDDDLSSNFTKSIYLSQELGISNEKDTLNAYMLQHQFLLWWTIAYVKMVLDSIALYPSYC